jgi:hypothetical protein
MLKLFFDYGKKCDDPGRTSQLPLISPDIEGKPGSMEPGDTVE